MAAEIQTKAKDRHYFQDGAWHAVSEQEILDTFTNPFHLCLDAGDGKLIPIPVAMLEEGEVGKKAREIFTFCIDTIRKDTTIKRAEKMQRLRSWGYEGFMPPNCD